VIPPCIGQCGVEWFSVDYCMYSRGIYSPYNVMVYPCEGDNQWNIIPLSHLACDWAIKVRGLKRVGVFVHYQYLCDSGRVIAANHHGPCS